MVVSAVGDPSARDLEKLSSPSWLSTQGSQSCSLWSQSGLKTKGVSLKQDKRRSREQRSLPDSPHTHKKDNADKVLEHKDSAGTRVKETSPADVSSDTKTQNSEINQEILHSMLHKQEGGQETIPFKPHKPEIRKGPRREVLWPEDEAGSVDTALARRKGENGHEQEERRRKRKSEMNESFPSQVKNRFGSKHLEKTVSIRLVDIRNSETEDYFIDGVTNKRGPVSLESVTITKLNKNNMVPDTAPKANSWLRKAHSASANSSHRSNGPVGGHLKSWGKFKIPRRSERPSSREQEIVEQRKPLLRPLTNTPEPSLPRMRLRSGLENDGYDADAKSSDGEVEPCLKRCHSHPLRGDSSLSRRYGSDIIRRGVLAS